MIGSKTTIDKLVMKPVTAMINSELLEIDAMKSEIAKVICERSENVVCVMYIKCGLLKAAVI